MLSAINHKKIFTIWINLPLNLGGLCVFIHFCYFCSWYHCIKVTPTLNVQGQKHRHAHLIFELLAELQWDGEKHQRVVQPRHHTLHFVHVAHLKLSVVHFTVGKDIYFFFLSYGKYKRSFTCYDRYNYYYCCDDFCY